LVFNGIAVAAKAVLTDDKSMPPVINPVIILVFKDIFFILISPHLFISIF
jgi:hypothetical protein